MISNHTPIKRQKAQKQQADNIKSWYWEQLQSNSLLRGMWNGFVTLENSLVVSYKLNVQSYNVHFKDTYTLFKIVNNLPAIQDMDSIPELGRSPGEENGNPLQYSCLENSMDRGTWQAIQSMGSQRVGRDLVGRITIVGSHSLLKGIFPNQESNLSLLHCRKTLHHLSHEGSLNNNKTAE